MKKRLLSVLLMLVLVFCLLPALTPDAKAADTPPQLYLGGVEMKDGDYLLKGATATTRVKPTATSACYAYYKDGTLLLHNYSYAGQGFLNNSVPNVLLCRGSLTIKLEGVNTLTQTEEWSTSRAITVYGDLTIMGGHDLDVVSTKTGIYADEDILIDNDGGEIDVKSAQYGLHSYGYYGGKVIVNGGEVIIRTTHKSVDSATYAILSDKGIVLGDTLKIKASVNENAAFSELGEFKADKIKDYDFIRISPALPEKVNAVASALKYDSALNGYAPDFKTFNVTLQNGYTTTELNDGSSALYETLSAGSYSDILKAAPKVGKTYYGYVDIRSTDWAYDISEETCNIRIANFDVTVTSWSEREMGSYARIAYEATYKGGLYVGGVAMQNGDYLAVGATETTTTKPSGGYAYYKDGKLTLNKYSFTGAGYRYYYYSIPGYTAVNYSAIYSELALDVELIGTNILNQTKRSSEAIFVSGAALTVGGDGILTVTADGYGMYAAKNLVINGGTIHISTETYEALRSKDGSITVNGGNVTAISKDQAIDFGVKFVVADGMDCFAASTTDGEPGNFIYNNFRTYKKIVVQPHVHSWIDATCTAPKTCTVCSATEGSELGHSWVAATCTAPKTCTVCSATEGSAHGHSWIDATCTAPKTCSVCYATDGSAKGHSWIDATCTAPKTCSVCNTTDGSAKGHSWVDANCTTPKTCSGCGITEGSVKHDWDSPSCLVAKTCKICSLTEGAALGHSWVDATCTAPKTCSVCYATEGSAKEHSWIDATCTAPKTCSVCYTTDGSALGHNWAEATCTAPKTCTVCSATEGSAKGHSWAAATCTAPKTCTVCSATEGSAKGHSWAAATCTAPKTCTVCSATEGGAKGHSWAAATCTAPKTCTVCSATEGSAKGHSWAAATCTAPKTCSVCSTIEGSALGHSWVAATCTAPKTCSVCSTTEGSALGHSWIAATCTAPKTCSVCGATEGSAKGHSWSNGFCTECGIADPTPVVTTTPPADPTPVVPTTPPADPTPVVPTTTPADPTPVVPTTTPVEPTPVVPTTTPVEPTPVVPTTTPVEPTPVVPTTTPVEPTPVVPTTPPADPTPVVPTTPPADPTPVVTTPPPADPTPVVPTTPPVDPTPVVPTTPPVEPTPVVPTTPPADPTPVVPTTPPADPTPVVPTTPPVDPTPVVPTTPPVDPTPVVPTTPSVDPTPVVPTTPPADPTPVVPTTPPVDPTPTPISNPFVDVAEKDYFFKPVLWAVANQITAGTSATTFGSNDTCTRAQVVTFLWAVEGRPEPTTTVNPFKDVKETDWYYKAVLWAVGKNITAGTSATTFGPNVTCTRGQVVTFLYSAENKK